MPGFVAAALKGILDIDRIDMKNEGEYVKKTYTTTALRRIGDRMVDKKIKLFDLIDPPMKLPRASEVVSKEKLEENPIFTQWNVTVRTRKSGIGLRR